MNKLKKMDLKDIQELIKFVAKSGATEVDLEIDNIKISIKSPAKKRRGEEDEMTTVIQKVPTPVIATPAQVTMPVGGNSSETLSADESNYITINASMIGTFYRSSSPETLPFVNVGDSIKEGDIICIVEAMKLFNEIESEVSGKIVKVLVDDITPIEFDQPLFLVEPS
jgi:acetyl-CoA carboxylase biotin carboxyl carrier protein